MRTLEETVVVRQFLHLLRRRVHQFLAAVTDIHAPKTGHAVQHFLPVRIVNVHAVGTRNNSRTLLMQFFVIRKRVQVVTLVQFLPVLPGLLFDNSHRNLNQTLNIRISRSYGVIIS